MYQTSHLFRPVIAGIFLFLLMLSMPGAAQVRRPVPVPDLPGYRTLKCDFHMHTVFSDGEVWPTVRVKEAWRDGLDAIAITDHDGYHPHKEDLKPDCARAYELTRSEAAALNLILVPAIELAEKDIHFNALFVTDANALLGGKRLAESLPLAHSQDAFVFWNHPGWKQTPQWFPPVAEAFDKGLFQGIELVNGPDFYPEAFPWVEERKLTILANSDAHEPVLPAQAEGQRPITLVFARTADVAGIREALFSRRTAAWMGGDIWGPEALLKGLWGGAAKSIGELSLRPGADGVALRLHNDSALPFRIRCGQLPAWLRGPSGTAFLPGLGELAVELRAAKGTAAGRRNAELELELLNFHLAPGKNLTVRLPLTVNVLQ
jgi:hypothetical protein